MHQMMGITNYDYTNEDLPSILEWMTENEFVQQDNVSQKYVNRIYTESLTHFANRLFLEPVPFTPQSGPVEEPFETALDNPDSSFPVLQNIGIPPFAPPHTIQPPCSTTPKGRGSELSRPTSQPLAPPLSQPLASLLPPIIRPGANLNPVNDNPNRDFLMRTQRMAERPPNRPNAPQGEHDNARIQAVLDYYNANIAGDQPVQFENVRNNAALLGRIASQVIQSLRQRAAGAAKAKKGMRQLEEIVINLQKDVKRNTKAITLAGARDIVQKRNNAFPNSSPWTATSEDPNRDGIPDIYIRNGSGHPLYINGYTVGKSDWPARFDFYTHNDADTRRRYREEHGGQSLTIPEYMKTRLGYSYNNDFASNPHTLGDMVGYQTPEDWNGWQTSNYRIPKEKRKNAFSRFRDYIINHVSNVVFRVLRENQIADVTNKYKVQILMKAAGILWKAYIINRVAGRHNVNPDSDAFKKWARKDGKNEIDEEVSSLLLHVLHTNGEHWTAENRAQLQNNLYHDFANATLEAIRASPANVQNIIFHNNEFNRPVPAQIQHPNDAEEGEWHENVQDAYNQEHDGRWDVRDDDGWEDAHME